MTYKPAKQILTMKGYDLFEVVSAFQKAIRRGKEDEAMFWGVELHESGFIPYAWKRMIVISTEDIGLANPQAPLMIKTLKEMYEDMAKANDKKKQFRLPYVQAILYLVHSPKSRHTDWALNYWFDSHLFDEYNMEIPDYALDIHTRRGKRMGKTITEFFTEGSVIENAKDLPNEKFYMHECQKRWEDKDWCSRADAEKARRLTTAKQASMPRATKSNKTEQSGSLFP